MEDSTASAIRPARDDDTAEPARITLAAFEPIFAMFEAELGPAVFRLIWPDWRSSQSLGVEALCGERDKHAVLGAELDGAPVGFVAWDVDVAHHTAEVQLLAVDPRYQNRGIGTALYRAVLDRARAAGVTLIRVETGADPAHAPARRSYEKAGYVAMPLVRYFQALER